MIENSGGQILFMLACAFLFALGGSVATLAVRDGSAFWWLVGASVLSGLMTAVGA